jgi:predicted Zn-dependent protease
MFSTHPATENRIAELQLLAEQMGANQIAKAPRRSALDPLG